MKTQKKPFDKANKVNKTSVIKHLVNDAKPIKWHLLGAVIISVASVLAMLFTPKVLGSIIDSINEFWLANINGGATAINLDSILRLCLILGGLFLVSGLASSAKMFVMNNVVSRRFTCAIRVRISEKIKHLPISYIDKTPQGEVISRMTQDVSHMGNSIHTFLDLSISGILQVIGISIMMFLINWQLALIVLALVPISVAISTIISSKSEKYFDETQKCFGKIYTHTNESFTGYKTVKAYNLEQQMQDKMSEISEVTAKCSAKAWYLGDIVQPIIAFTNSIGYIIICLIGAKLAMGGTISVGDVVAVILYSKQFSGPLEGIATGISQLQRVFASSKRVYEMMDEKEMEVRSTPSQTKTQGVVEFKDVSFSYTDKPLIEHLNFKVEKGQKIAIVGPTGGGKTTIINLLMGFYDLNGGQILIDGEDISKISRESLREKIGMVLQDTWLFSGTVGENIAYAYENATAQEIETAADDAYCDHFIRTLGKSYDTIIGDDMTAISQGQKQLLTIARVFLAKRDILILDEATSNVDTRTEILLQKALKKLQKDKTSFVIAHRLSTILDADKILVVNHGTVVEQGKHSELLAKNGFYAEIFNSQYAMKES
ncbi:MAG: ABC transporter ATP-binding protein [Clostridia bacterium]